MIDDRVYRVDTSYDDLRDPGASNEFVRWLKIRSAGGIRDVMTTERHGDVSDIAALVLVSRHVAGSGYNPWEDVIDRQIGRIWYWGDAKANDTKRRDDFGGNRRLVTIWEAINAGTWDLVPPILHFSKYRKGEVHFNGLCVLANLEEAWFEDDGRRVRNYRAVLDVLPVQDVPLIWILDRRSRRASDRVPDAWKQYAANGRYAPLRAWVDRVRTAEAQLPSRESSAWSRLEALSRIPPSEFEQRIVSLLRRLPVAHSIEGTRAVRDGGFDFFGSFRMPPPLSYVVPLKGEVKRYRPDGGGVGPIDVARLVARLQRGEHGVFVTTSYYTKQCQEEVFADRYPVELIAGGQLVGMFAQAGIE